jgi:hypothetical protein
LPPIAVLSRAFAGAGALSYEAPRRREVREREARHARERAKDRNLTDAEMARWVDYVRELVAEERAAPTELISNERDFQREVVAYALAEIRREIEDNTKQAIAKAIDVLRQEIIKQAAVESGSVVELPNPLTRRGNVA